MSFATTTTHKSFEPPWPLVSDRIALPAVAKVGRFGRFGSYRTLRKKVADGELPAERVGLRIFVHLDDLEAMATPVVDHPTTAASVEKAIDRIVASAPRLSAEQRDRLAGLLGGGAA